MVAGKDFFQVGWNEFITILDRGLYQSNNRNLIHWKETEKRLFLYYTFEGDRYCTVVDMNIVDKLKLQQFAERYLTHT
ncbi:hypothetical protein LCGC14_2521800, partial [marine sediment metagenome]